MRSCGGIACGSRTRARTATGAWSACVNTVGYLMAAHGVDAVTAFNLLRRVARYQRRKVAEVAQHLLDAGTLP